MAHLPWDTLAGAAPPEDKSAAYPPMLVVPANITQWRVPPVGSQSLKLPEDFVLHSLRHTFSKRLGEAGADAFTIMKLMGRGTVAISQRYVHRLRKSMEGAVSRVEALNSSKLRKRAQKVSTVNAGVETSERQNA
jgi:hypothetical protein